MVHISEISHIRVKHPSEFLKQGQKVKVQVLKIDPGKGGRRKIALSVKALEQEPWEKGFPFKEGEVISGTVSRLADFGSQWTTKELSSIPRDASCRYSP